MTLEDLQRVGVFSRGIARIPRLPAFLGCGEIVPNPSSSEARSLSAVAGWGHKPTARAAREFARTHGVPYLALEDGFLRSVGLGGSEPPLSLVLDDLGIYYDAGGPSRIEQLLAEEPRLLEDSALLARANRLRKRLVETGVSKYNQGKDALPAELQGSEPYVLVADQTFDDASVSLGLASAESFERMLAAARTEHPGARLVIKVHPDTLAGKKRGYLARRPPDPDTLVIAENITPQRMLAGARHAYVCTSQLGFEALLSGVPVTCFGAPFYAGWGLTDDRQNVARRGRKLTIDALAAAALLLYPRYVHPISGEPCEAEEVLEHLALQRTVLAENRRRFVCFGFSSWKRPFVRRYLAAPGGEVRFVRSPRQVAETEGVTAVVWASRSTPAIQSWARQARVPLWNMEDGFLRSVGLGSDLTAPGSLVLDRQGIYYDPRSPSELEVLLQSAEFSVQELERAATLRRLILSTGISKYNSAGPASLNLEAAGARKIVLVVGQVDDDASVRYGSTGAVKGNLSLLAAVRSACPDAFVLYKPHPDVLSGNRRGALAPEGAPPWDSLIGQVPLSACLSAVHEVHTLTSLVGFEALLRGLPVVTYGTPFYAGWGLTTDRAPQARRTRRLSLDELTAGVLLRYPRYYSWPAHAFCTPEQLVLQLAREAAQNTGRRPPKLLRKAQSLATAAREWLRFGG
ncbi:MAG TPA: capsular polysaccharide biosynthesis protein [Polyangiaceae bacterium]|nr:capsular polysaccharide biosynthesis protein [Polyangiaceae bacterium]